MTPCKAGDRGENVKLVQRALKSLSYPIDVDGVFGPSTARALMEFQRGKGLAVNGDADVTTLKALSFAVPAEMPAPIAVSTDPPFDPVAFEASMIDRRAFHSPLVKRGGKLERYEPAGRAWRETRGFTLHQTACNMGERIERYDAIGAHFVVLRSGRVLRMADLNSVVFHGNGWNAQCVGIEIDGLYAGLEDIPETALDESLRTTWDDPTTPTREKPMRVTPQAMLATRNLIRWGAYEIARNGGKLEVLCAHRQSSLDRRNDPGEEIWKQVALPLHAELGLTDGGVGFKIGGYAIPERWDPRCKGVLY